MSARLATRPDALERGVAHLRSLQSDEGWWKGELRTNVTMDAEDLLMREFLGLRTATRTEQTARWLRSQQRPGGGWSTFPGGPDDLSTTVEAWLALRLAGDAENAPHLTAAAATVRELGGVERSRVFTRMWLALSGLWSWEDLPQLPPEVVLLPPRFPLSLTSFGCWARQTVVPLTIVSTLRASRPVEVDLSPLRTGAVLPPPAQPWALLDRALAHYHRHPLRGLRARALRRAGQWILERQEADGSWGGIQPPWVWSLLALHLLGPPYDGLPVRRALMGLERYTVREQTEAGVVRRVEACQSPVWDTALAVTALYDAGTPAEDPAVLRAASWLRDEQVRRPGDWSVRRPGLAPGGWSFEFDNDLYPDVDDTAVVVLALRAAARGDVLAQDACDLAVAWTLGMQSRDGGWAAFDVDNTSRLPAQLPFCDFGEVIDPPSADVTAHVVETLARERTEGRGSRELVQGLERGVRWLLDAQEDDGSWFGRWGVNHVYGTGAAVPALIAAGVHRSSLPVRRAVTWLESRQGENGGWGEDLRSYTDPAWVGRGASTPSQTAWALLALLAADERSPAIESGVRWLQDAQLADGSWAEEQYTGTGFPGDFSIGYDIYRVVFPVQALACYQALSR